MLVRIPIKKLKIDLLKALLLPQEVVVSKTKAHTSNKTTEARGNSLVYNM